MSQPEDFIYCNEQFSVNQPFAASALAAPYHISLLPGNYMFHCICQRLNTKTRMALNRAHTSAKQITTKI